MGSLESDGTLDANDGQHCILQPVLVYVCKACWNGFTMQQVGLIVHGTMSKM